MYKIILVPIDISEKELIKKALKHALYIAKLSDAKLHFFHVAPDMSRYSMSYSYHYDLLANFAKKTIESSEKQLEKIVKHIDYPKEKISYSVEMGSPRDKVLSEAEKIGADLIIVGSRRPNIATHLLGSNASAIVSNAPISILIVR
ncbi:MAG TPA: universal stress protein [Arsenophonus apicola]|jgi:nucleotide-binding universal stress UspA family protein|uniref:universal stress protein n=1 Tax=Arsenophonus TaxID=637 RepID=UPI0015D78B4C|nr:MULTISPECIES: universal stress protein [Arsenophonus]UBX28001.1 universal stress protein [Arsenophonus apicola]